MFGGAVHADMIEIGHHVATHAVDVNYVAVDAERFHAFNHFLYAQHRCDGVHVEHSLPVFDGSVCKLYLAFS